MRNLLLFALIIGFYSSCSAKKDDCKEICEEQNCIEEVKIEVRHHSRW
jgi:hypothetical protein